MFFKKGGFTPLDEISAHYADDIIRTVTAGLLDKISVSLMKWVEFCDYSCGFHPVSSVIVGK